jgi:cytochrome P450
LIPSAVDEFLRFNTPLPFMTRVAADDLEMGGVRIREGQVVFLGFGAANRDPEVFPDPDRLDITRRGGAHLAFGHGPHFCLGYALARMEITALFTALLREFPNLRLLPLGPPELRNENLMCRGFHSLLLLT